MSWAILGTLLKQGAQAKLQKEYGAFLIAPEAGYEVTLKLDTAKITPDVSALMLSLSSPYTCVLFSKRLAFPFTLQC